jgi:putative ABC transport system ATP-binding protein
MMSDQAMIELRNVSKIYGMGDIQVVALDGVSIDIREGEFVAVMGPSGSGKSSLMNILGCLDRPTLGTYRLSGQDVSELSRADLAHIRNRRIGFIFQSFNLLPRVSALKNVVAPLLYDPDSIFPRNCMEQIALETLDSVGLRDRAGHQPHELSGGQSQRVAIARALVNDPDFILADEPTGNLDSPTGEEIMGLLEDLNRQGRTIVMVTHDSDIADHTQRTIHLLDGRIDKISKNGREPVPAEASEVHREV